MPHTPELLTPDGYHIDLSLPDRDGAADRVALLLTVPAHHHVLADADGRHAPTAETRLKWRQLRAMGWNVVPVPFYEWDALGDTDARRDYIATTLHSSGALRMQ